MINIEDKTIVFDGADLARRYYAAVKDTTTVAEMRKGAESLRNTACAPLTDYVTVQEFIYEILALLGTDGLECLWVKDARAPWVRENPEKVRCQPGMTLICENCRVTFGNTHQMGA